MPLVYLAAEEALFLWGDTPRELGHLEPLGRPARAPILTPRGRAEVDGLCLPLVEGAAKLAIIPAAEVDPLPPSCAIWTLASKLAFELVSRERIVPTVGRHRGRLEARWAAALSAEEDAARVAQLGKSMPPAAHAVPVGEEGTTVWAPDALLRAYLDAVVDALVRAARGGPALRTQRTSPWDQRWQGALLGDERDLVLEGFRDRSVEDDLARWSQPALGERDRLRACFRLEPPAGDREPFRLRFFLQSPDDPSLLLSAGEVWQNRGRILDRLAAMFRDPQESLLEALGRAARLFPPIAAALEQARPEELELDPHAAWLFLGDGAAALGHAGFSVLIPSELTSAGQRRLRLRMRLGGRTKVAGVVEGAAGLALDDLLEVDWQAVIGDQELSLRELSALARQKAPLVRYRGEWVAIDPEELGEIQRRLAEGPGTLSVREAIPLALRGETEEGELAVSVSAAGLLAELLDRLRQGVPGGRAVPPALQATLRPYQRRGLDWLSTLGELGLGACLADDMGLGKTVQVLAWLLRRREDKPDDRRPSLLVAPTSVVGNWQREIERFAPSLKVTSHHGASRVKSAADLGEVVLTSYALLRRDAELFATVDWAAVVLDEAQNIKNASSQAAKAARSLRASHRIALSGTPVENRLAELWSIFEFANPGLLGPLDHFRRHVAVPVERYGDDEAAGRLRRMVAPFLLRRVKSDPAVIQDLPAKHEMKVFCSLSREQVSLYKAVVDEELRAIAESEGITRRGRVLALLTHTKQICNHPSQYLGDAGPLPGRSGKLTRLTEMLEEAVAAGDKALVFTQYREMGDRLVSHLEAQLGCEIGWLHGATTVRKRDELVRRFQEDPRGPRVFVLSLKAGGTGLNLTAASHVFHFDRWWNPAVEDQATDRAYRIGQRRAVQVHKLVCSGTVEDKIDRLLDQKRDLAAKVVGAGERWITELGTRELRDLFSLAEGAVSLTDDDDAPTGRKAVRA
jgi:superfamily II DNA or RNA helicase